MIRKLFFHYLFIMMMVLLTSGCAAPQFTAQSDDLPDWVLSPVQDNINTLYGLGQGSSMETAKQAALADVAAKLFVKVSGSTTVEIHASNNIVRESVQDSIKTQINETQLSHYNVDQVASVDESYWVQLNIPRNILVQNTEKLLNLSNQELNASFQIFRELSSVRQYIRTPELSADVESAMTSWILLQALDPSRRNDDLNKTYAAYMALLSQARESLFFFIIYNEDTHGFADLLAVLLSKESIETKQTSYKKNDSPTINISGTFNTLSLFDEKQVRADITITVHDERGVLIAKRLHLMAGSSVSSYGSAKRSAARRLADKFEEQGIQENLGIASTQPTL